MVNQLISFIVIFVFQGSYKEVGLYVLCCGVLFELQCRRWKESLYSFGQVKFQFQIYVVFIIKGMVEAVLDFIIYWVSGCCLGIIYYCYSYGNISSSQSF